MVRVVRGPGERKSDEAAWVGPRKGRVQTA